MSTTPSDSYSDQSHTVETRIGRDNRNSPYRLLHCVECGLESPHDALYDRVSCPSHGDLATETVAEAAAESLTVTETTTAVVRSDTVLRDGERYALILRRNEEPPYPHHWRICTVYSALADAVRVPGDYTAGMWAVATVTAQQQTDSKLDSPPHRFGFSNATLVTTLPAEGEGTTVPLHDERIRGTSA